jgi:3-dehydroquinate synthase
MAPSTLDFVFPRSREKCSIIFGDKLLEQLDLELFSVASSMAIISDDNVAKLYSGKLLDRLSGATKTALITFKHGERNKNLATVAKITKIMSELGLDRKSMILALGGGVVGDLAGFVASIFKRGITYFQIPTTLLAQVDSSIGGKCGVDTEWGKNQIGSFYQPAAVLIDSSTLDSLPEREIINGLGEIVKSGIIADRTLFRAIESAEEYSIQKLKPIVRDTCRIKAKIVEADERESNLRNVLNYGHTIGHALESSSGYRLSHGKSVILGMACEGWIACELGVFDPEDYDRQRNLLKRIVSQFKVGNRFDPKAVLSFARLDKKNVGGVLNMSLPEKIGRMHSTGDNYSTPVSKSLLLKSLENLRNDVD